MPLRLGRTAVLGTLLLLTCTGLWAAEAQDVQKVIAEFGPATEVKMNPATGTARFVRLAPAAPAALARGRTPAFRPNVEAVAADFLARHGGLFGLRDAQGELTLVGRTEDAYGGEHLTYAQHRDGVPVFAAAVKTHFDAAGQLRVVNGLTIPDVDVAVAPERSAEDAGRVAQAVVASQGKGDGVAVRATRLFVYRAGLLKGVRGTNHLVWQVEVGDGADVREFVFVDAHTGKVVDQVTGVTDALNRRAYQTTANFPATPFWVEGQAFPTADVEANNVITGSGETHGFFLKGFGRDSFDNGTGPLGGIMHGIFRRTQSCPNASWNGTFTSYCAGVTPDDVVAHEWGHAYTEYTHGLIYQWQSGALNESYSDIFGEAVDLTNGRGSDAPGGVRTDNFCSSLGALPYVLTVNSPAAIAGDYPAGRAQFGPPLDATGLTGDIVLADDGVGAGVPPAESVTDGCCAGPTFECAPNSWPNAAAIAGKIAMVDRGTCGFAVKVKNAQLQGAIGVVVANHVTGGDGTITMAGADPTITIPSVSVGYSNGNIIRGQLPAPGVNATMHADVPGLDASYRWLVSEDSAAFGGAIRDMWSPTCLGSPGKVTDQEYHCATSDAGGVHVNSGIPNHAFALLVDGGSYNGQTIASIGLVKAIHIYYRAMTVYQGPASNFADHADAIEQSCEDLVGVDLVDPATGLPSGQSLTATDCQQVANAALAVELRTPPTQCDFKPMLAKEPPDRCEAGTRQANVYRNDFESNPIGSWTVTHTAAFPGFTPRDWEWTGGLPDRDGSALFAENTRYGACTGGAGDESGVLHAVSPVVTLPPGASNPRFTFDHYVATEAGFDGGNVKISVNGGAWAPIAPADFTYNPYNLTLATVAQGNTNPLAGQPAFSGGDGGTVSGSWGRSHVNLASYAAPGDTVQLRFDFGQDGCTGVIGWYFDDPTLYTCVPGDKPSISINDVSVVEGNSGYTNATFTVSLSHPSSRPVTVLWVTVPNSASLFHDFVPEVDYVTIPPLQLEATLDVKVVGDKKRESDETFYVWLFLPDNAVVSDEFGRGTIVNDDTRR